MHSADKRDKDQRATHQPEILKIMFCTVFRILDPGPKVKKIPDPVSGSASKNLSIFNPKQKIVSKLSEISELLLRKFLLLLKILG